MDNLKFCAPCLLGVEGICANDLKFNGIENAQAENGRVVFSGDYNTLARANLISRYSERIQIILSEFNVYSFEELFESVKNIPWERFIGKSDAFPVKGSSLNSKLYSVSDCQKIIKKAVVDRLSSKYGISWFEETGSVHQIQFLIRNDRASILLDTSGDGLHKRGYRSNSNDAPIKETLAAVMVDLARVRANHFVVDPMCGSGTILIESALKALKIAPGLNRGFSAEKWAQIPSSVWKEEREKARSVADMECSFKAIGYDIDDNALEIARLNARKAGVGDRIEFKKRDLRDFEFDSEFQTTIVNPPYGERLLDINEAEKLYKIMGEKFLKQKGKSYAVITPDDDFEKIFGRKADKRRKLYNGMLKCQLYMYFKS
ncbi:MAG: class I SAM-dependent RNA methyltransferase [Ruminococcus sp.]|nr:class I SAM-dependent RNA methyltransferase [Ruminococcus sp.]